MNKLLVTVAASAILVASAAFAAPQDVTPVASAPAISDTPATAAPATAPAKSMKKHSSKHMKKSAKKAKKAKKAAAPAPAAQ